MSNKRKRRPQCSVPDCGGPADVEARTFTDDGVVTSRQWLCRAHAVDRVRHHKGRVFGDPLCDCGTVDGILGEGHEHP